MFEMKKDNYETVGKEAGQRFFNNEWMDPRRIFVSFLLTASSRFNVNAVSVAKS